MRKKILIILLILLPFFTYSQDNKSEPKNNKKVELTESEMEINFGNQVNNQGGAKLRTSFWDFLKMIFILIIIIVIVVLFFRIIKKVAGGSPKNEDGFMKVVSSLTLFSDRYLHIVKISNNYYLISSASESVNLMEKIEDKELIDAIVLFESSNPEEQEDFADKLKSALLGKKSKVSIDEKITDLKKFMKNQNNKLKKKN